MPAIPPERALDGTGTLSGNEAPAGSGPVEGCGHWWACYDDEGRFEGCAYLTHDTNDAA